jgi:hypothetical protein
MSQDLFAAFGSEERASATKASSSRSGPARHNPAGPPKPLDLEAILNAKPYDEFQTTTTVNMDEDDDDFGDFEDASPMDAETRAAILKARMGSPMPNMETPFFDIPMAKPTSPNKPRTPSKPVSSPFKSRTTEPARSSPSPSKPAPVSNLPFKPRPAGPIHVPISSSRPPAASKPVSNLPFKPKPTQLDSKAENVGAHPFAGRMDMLFDLDDNDYDAGADDLNVDLANDPEAAMAYSKKLIADSMAHQKPQVPSASRPELPKKDVRPANKLRKKSAYAPAKNLDMLFDADNLSDNHDDEDDDWGTFESGSVEPPQASNPVPKAVQSSGGALGPDLLGLDDTSTQWATLQNEIGTAPAISQYQQSSTQNHQDDDAWDDFESVAPSSAPSTTKTVPNLPKSTINIAAPANPTTAPSLPPTNIPPPAVLLSIFPSLIASAQAALFDTLAKIPQDQKQELLGHEATHQFLRGYIGLSVVLAHIISGRKQRWKRDQFLAQGMRIGPAAAGGKSGGMKLAGVDKSEAAKEDREVLDAVRQWRAVVGKLRSAVSGANVRASVKLPPLPEISEQMFVKALKPTEGGIVAPHACALCGLKREERVAKVDEGVDDSFGEWWVQGMNMHLLCKNFWDEHRELMRSR